MEDIILYRTAELLQMPEPDAVIADYLREDQVGVVYGPPNQGKTFLVLDWALHVATGLPWHGKTVKQGPVIYLAGEGASSLQTRVAGWLHYHGLDEVDAPVYWQTRGLNLRDTDVLEDLREEIVSVDVHWRLLVVDTLSQFFGGGEENGPDMALFVQHCRALVQDSGHCAVLIVHHTNATAGRERGHTALRGNTDMMLQVTGVEQDARLIGLRLQTDKQRDDVKQGATQATLTRIVLPQRHLTDRTDRSTLVLTDLEPWMPPNRESRQPRVMDIKSMLKVLACMDESPTWNEWRIACGIPRGTFKSRVSRLTHAGTVEKDSETGRYQMPVSAEDLIDYGT